ncbi:MAG: ATP-dependent helicase [Thermoplasmata archaeon]
MIERASREYSDDEIFSLLLPEVATWFRENFGRFTVAQRYAIKEIHDGRNVLISSPTGSGKTLSAFTASINELFRMAFEGKLEDKVYVLYISPLKALNNDIEKNLNEPLKGIYKIFEKKHKTKLEIEKIPKIRIATRTGDTPTKARQAQLRKPPHILITTPETLAIILNAPRFAESLKELKWIIVDEVHALAENKRGVHLSLSLERLTRMISREPVRIGLSATIHPLDEVAKFLVGMKSDGRKNKTNSSDGTYIALKEDRLKEDKLRSEDIDIEDEDIEEDEDINNVEEENENEFKDDESKEAKPEFLVSEFAEREPRDCIIVDVNYFKELDLEVISPCEDFIYSPAQEMSESLYKLLDDLISTHKTTLIFTNTRSATERVTFHLKNKFGNKYVDCIGAHHSSLSKSMRLEVEEKLKKGELKVVVTSTSLELGIDIGYIDLVILLGSPKSISRCLQRIGRSGHRLCEVSKGRIVVLDRDDLVECLVLMNQAKEKKIDGIRIPENCLDVLCQHVVGMSLEKAWVVDEALELIRCAYPYRELSKERFLSVLRYLGGYHENLEEKHVYGKIWFDGLKFGKRGKLTRALYCMNVGTIPDEVSINVFREDGSYIGKVEEDFVEKLLPGDIFVLGGKTYAFKYARGMSCYVESADSKRPTVPRWFSEQLPLSYSLGLEIQKFRSEFGNKIMTLSREDAILYLKDKFKIGDKTANAVYNYFYEQLSFAKLPNYERLLIEEYVDEELRKNYIFHCVVGRRVNEAIARAFAQRVSEMHSCNVGISVSDNGFVITVPNSRKISEELLFGLVHPCDLAYYLRSSLEKTEMLKRRFRHVAARSFLILRKYLSRTSSVGRQQMNAQILFSTVKRMDKSFPVLVETYREIMEDAMDIKNARKYLEKIQNGEIKIEYLRNRYLPSPFAFNLVLMGNSDTILMEDRREMLRMLHQRVMKKIEELDKENVWNKV